MYISRHYLYHNDDKKLSTLILFDPISYTGTPVRSLILPITLPFSFKDDRFRLPVLPIVLVLVASDNDLLTGISIF